MIRLPIIVAFMLSAVAGFATAGAAMSPLPQKASDTAARFGACGPDARVAAGGCVIDAAESRQVNRQRYIDCHRDVRTHRINGVMIRHRHVGPNCAIREVRGNS